MTLGWIEPGGTVRDDGFDLPGARVVNELGVACVLEDMRRRVDVSGVLPAAGSCSLLDRLDESEVISLGVLSGADLCALGATEHPVCWEALKGAWWRLDERERERLAEASALGMLRRGLVEDLPAGRGVEALIGSASYKPGAELGFLLGARQCPAVIIATHHESRTPAITYFQPQGVSAIVEEIPERVDNGLPGTPRNPLNVIFGYRLLTSAFAARELARWAMKPIPVVRYQPRAPRLIGFFSGSDGGGVVSYQLTIHADGERAHVDGPDISAELASDELAALMAGVISPGCLGRLPGDDEAGVTLVQDVAGR
jgi:hypothetical protein